MAELLKILAQGTVSATAPATFFSAVSGQRTVVTDIIITNVTNAAQTFSICVTPSGTSYTSANAIFWNNPISAYNTVHFSFSEDRGLAITAAGSIGIGAVTTAAVTFTVLGLENKI